MISETDRNNGKNKVNVWNTIIQEEKGKLSRVEKDPVEDNSFAEQPQKKDCVQSRNFRERDS